MVFYIEQVKFLRLMLEEALKAVNASCYAVSDLSECDYLLHDLSPELIFVDLATVANQEDKFLEIWSTISQIPVVVSGWPAELENQNRLIEISKGSIQKPIDVSQIVEQLNSYIDN